MSPVTKISVVGTGHLADATCVCCSKYFEMAQLGEADLVWFCVNTPVDEYSRPCTEYVQERLRDTLARTPTATPVLISSQVPVGFCSGMQDEFPEHHLASQPENIRTASAEKDFEYQDRMIVGTRHPEDHDPITQVLSRFTNHIYFMSPESAEMQKHALNAFLAMEIAFANEIEDVCKMVGADVADVVKGFTSDRRVGDGPLRPGGPAKGSLPRDVAVLTGLYPGPLLAAIRTSNLMRERMTH